jgi:hypothetical protein
VIVQYVVFIPEHRLSVKYNKDINDRGMKMFTQGASDWYTSYCLFGYQCVHYVPWRLMG